MEGTEGAMSDPRAWPEAKIIADLFMRAYETIPPDIARWVEPVELDAIRCRYWAASGAPEITGETRTASDPGS